MLASVGRKAVAKVAWQQHYKAYGPSKVFGLIVDCDKMVGKDFEKGLASLRAIAEAAK